VQAAALEERCQQLRVAAAERDYDTLTADCSKRERDAAALEPFSTYREQIGFGPCPIFPFLHIQRTNRLRSVPDLPSSRHCCSQAVAGCTHTQRAEEEEI
jgi:hypothetical protein